MSWSAGEDSCYWKDFDNPCGSYSYCSNNDTSRPQCNCIRGFFLKLEYKNKWIHECVRRTALHCGGDTFVKLKNMKLPEITSDEYNVTSGMNLAKCMASCLVRCGSTAYALVDNRKGEGLCVNWYDELYQMRNYTSGGQDLYVRVAANDHEDQPKNDGKSKGMEPWVIGLIVGAIIIGLLVIGFVCFCYWKKNVKEEEHKGILPDGSEVAVKRLANTSSQGMTEFKNEIETILNVLHLNLVRLLGCCCEGEEIILIYEYLENASLNHYIFG
ncbi:PREDICTED: receptor-like serine/threonine-protein kinase SD1-8 [Camelina sativa]|uniref:Receptor-like serine/threonine-protein kinase SD1-8 n=1 Tax=Camelina sativa TaxID=90675 RepID=A0ABM0TDD0_CAMSA|nr:PREDICTED: receptor-like serine/threonine-protein kinase SD1-8 [Camelina sativa]